MSASEILKHPWILSAKKIKSRLEDLLSGLILKSGIIFAEDDAEDQK